MLISNTKFIYCSMLDDFNLAGIKMLVATAFAAIVFSQNQTALIKAHYCPLLLLEVNCLHNILQLWFIR